MPDICCSKYVPMSSLHLFFGRLTDRFASLRSLFGLEEGFAVGTYGAESPHTPHLVGRFLYL